jgi:hypothetical protein
MTSHRRHRWATGPVPACALFVVVLTAGCGSQPPEPVEIQIPTAAQPATVCMDARIGGTLVASRRWGVALKGRGNGPPAKLIFPYGYRALVDDAGRVAIVDAAGRVVGHVGNVIDTGGGLVNPNGSAEREIAICSL